MLKWAEVELSRMNRWEAKQCQSYRQDTNRDLSHEKSTLGKFRPKRFVVAQHLLPGRRIRHAAAYFAERNPIIVRFAKEAEQLAIGINARRILIEFIDVTGAD